MSIQTTYIVLIFSLGKRCIQKFHWEGCVHPWCHYWEKQSLVLWHHSCDSRCFYINVFECFILIFKGYNKNMKHFFMKQQWNCVFYRLLKSKIHMPFLMFIRYKKYRKNEKNIGKKCPGKVFWLVILFELNLDNLQPVTTLFSTAGALITVSNYCQLTTYIYGVYHVYNVIIFLNLHPKITFCRMSTLLSCYDI